MLNRQNSLRALEGLAVAGSALGTSSSQPLHLFCPYTSLCGALVCQARGKRVSRPEPKGQVAYSV